MRARRAECDVLIVGGGIAGLWCRALLEREGYSVILIEKRALGAGQSVASQGILHAGLKYLVSGEDDAAPASLADEYARWMQRLAGRAWPDLSGTRVLAEKLVMWTTPSLASRAAGRLASPMMRSRVRRLEGDERPPAFREAPRGVAVWEVDEPAVDARSLIESVAAVAEGPLVHAEPDPASLRQHDDDAGITIDCDGVHIDVRAQAVVLAAGLGNAPLLAATGVDPDGVCQARPLHMVIARGAPAPIFGHCVQPSKKPRLTITSAPDAGGTVWYVGGAIAEPPGPSRTPEAQIAEARRDLGACLPWLATDALELGTFPVSRAEGRTASGRRPEGPVVHARGRVFAVWPTKLAMAPAAAERVLREIGPITPNRTPLRADEIGGLPAPPLAEPVWTWSQRP